MQEEGITMPLKKDPNESESSKTSSQTTSLSVQKGKSEGVLADKSHLKASNSSQEEEGTTTTTSSAVTAATKREGTVEDMSGRERLKRHRVEVAGRVWIPDMWGQENLLKDWIDCTACDFSMAKNSSIMSARASLMEQGRLRANSTTLSLENTC